MIVRLARKILGIDPNDVGDAVSYNSKKDINNRNSNFSYYYKLLRRRRKLAANFLTILNDYSLLSDAKSVVDIGCGSGNLLNLISSEYPNIRLLGNDFSEKIIESSKKVYPKIDFRIHDVYDKLDSKYDLVICTEVLEHLLYPHKALNNLVAGITSNGAVFITVPNGRIDKFGGHINFWSLESWNMFLEMNLPEAFSAESNLHHSNTLIYSIIKRK